MTAAFGKKTTLTTSTVRFPDGLTLGLGSFSHKRVREGDPSRASVQLHVTGPVTTELYPGVTGDGTRQQFDRLRFRGYEFELTRFSYDQSIELVVTKLAVQPAHAGAPFTLQATKPLAMLDDGFIVKLAGFGIDQHEAFVRLEVLLEGLVSAPIETKLYANGTPALKGHWVGPPGTMIDGRRIELVALTDHDVQLRVAATQ